MSAVAKLPAAQEAHSLPDITALAARVVGLFKIGDHIPMEWLQAEFGIRIPERGTRAEFSAIQLATLACMDALRDALLHDHLRALQNVRGIGYRLVHPEDQTGYALGKLRSDMAKDMRKCRELLDNIDHTLMSEGAIKRNTDARASIASLALMTSNRMGDLESRRPMELPK